jgi:acetate kinase
VAGRVNVLVVNAGSSSLKLRLLDGDDAILAEEELPAPRAQIDDVALHCALDSRLGREAEAVGHRIVHGGERFHGPVRIDADIETALRELIDLAPLHQPKSLAAMDAVTTLLPDLPAVACFDTAFHATLPAAAATYALPADWRERWGLRRYGFHGLSHAWVAHRAPQLLGRDPAGLRILSCHLGAGASLCAIGDGRSLDTTMGFTPLEGLVMATRSGSVDPGMLLWLAEREGLTAGELSEALEHRSGLLGLSGTADMREIVERAGVDDGSGVEGIGVERVGVGRERAGADDGSINQAARLALDVYVYRLRSGIAAMAAPLGGLDVLVFTGGVGEHSAAVRALATAGLAFLGVAVDGARNDETHADGDIGAHDATVRTLVLTAREDLEIARQVRRVLAGSRQR